MLNIKKEWKDGQDCVTRQNAIDHFNIRRVDGKDYLYYFDVRISTEEDADGNLLDRLDKIRQNYIEERLKNK